MKQIPWTQKAPEQFSRWQFRKLRRHKQVKSLETLEGSGQNHGMHDRFECNWDAFQEATQSDKASQTNVCDAANGSSSWEYCAKALDIVWANRIATFRDHTTRISKAIELSSIFTTARTLPGICRTEGILYTELETDFIHVGMETQWQHVCDQVQELLWRVDLGEAVYHLHLLDSCLPRECYIGSDDEDAGGQPLLNYDDEVCLIRSFAIPAHESRSGHSITLPEGCRARVRRTWGPPEQPTTVLVETFDGTWCRFPAQLVKLTEKAEWPDYHMQIVARHPT